MEGLMYTAAGVTYRQPQISAWVETQPRSTRHYTQGKIVSEPENAFDPNAKAILVNGVRFGYVNKMIVDKFEEGLCNIMISYWDQENIYLVKYSKIVKIIL
jgi:hypothetical protein